LAPKDLDMARAGTKIILSLISPLRIVVLKDVANIRSIGVNIIIVNTMIILICFLRVAEKNP
jgi:hypothetical protein